MPIGEKDMAVKWIPVRTAVTMLSRTAGGDPEAKLMIGGRLKDYQFTARARIREEVDIGRPVSAVPRPPLPMQGRGGRQFYVPGAPPFVPASEPMVLKSDFWRQSIDWDGDQTRWDWGAGVFVIRIKSAEDSNQARRIVAWEMMLDQAEIDTAMGKVSSLAITDDARSDRLTVTPLKYDWERVLIDLAIEVVDVGGFIPRFGDPHKRGTQAKLARWLQKRAAVYSKEEPSPSEAKKRARAVIDTLRQRIARNSAKKP